MADYLRKQALNYDSKNPPPSPNQGDIWRENIHVNSKLDWFWTGAIWLSTTLYQQHISVFAGQTISILGLTIGDFSASTENIPFSCGDDYDIYLRKLHGMFRVASGNLSASNYWQVQFRNNSSVLQSLNITAGNGGETTGYIHKSSPEINTKYSKLSTGLNVAITKNGNPPNMRSPVVLIEYRLAR